MGRKSWGVRGGRVCRLKHASLRKDLFEKGNKKEIERQSKQDIERARVRQKENEGTG
jgi:hypothetical protein